MRKGITALVKKKILKKLGYFPVKCSECMKRCEKAEFLLNFTTAYYFISRMKVFQCFFSSRAH